MTVATTVLSLGLGIGGMTTVFNVSDGLLHPPAPGLRDPVGLVTVYTSEDDGRVYGSSSYPDFEEVRGLSALDDAAASVIRLLSLDVDGSPEQLVGEAVSGNFFQVAGIQPVLGRSFLAEEGTAGAGAPVAVLGYDLWVDRFGAAPGVVGQVIRLNGEPVTVVGVAPKGIMSRRLPIRPDLWIPLASPQDPGRIGEKEDRNKREYLIFARYASGAGLDELRAQLTVLGDRLSGDFPEAWTDDAGRPRAFTAVSERRSRLNPGARMILGGVAAFLFIATGLVLLIACTNVTSLFLVRANRRGKEIALRLALGAKRRQIVRLLLAEGVLLGVLAGAVGVGFAHVLAGAMATFSLPVNVPLRLDFQPTGRAYAFAFTAALATSLVFSLVPALRVSRPDLASGLKNARSRNPAKRRLGLGSALVVVQLAASLVLIGGAGLFIRSLQNAATLDLGVDPHGVALMSQVVPEEVGKEGMETYVRDLHQRLGRLPGVQGAAVARGVELTLLQFGAAVSVRGSAGDPGDEGVAGFRNAVTPGYLDVLGIALLRGRGIEDGDGAGGDRVAVVNETLARTLWLGEDPLGRTFSMDDRSPGPGSGEGGTVTVRVVGVARDGNYLDVGDPPTPYVWTSLYQDPARTVALVVRGASAEAMVRELRSAVTPAPGQVQVLPPTTYESQLSFQFIHLRLASKVLGWGGAFGLFLAVIGVYGLVAYTVGERSREIAIRRAVGADAGHVVREVVWQAMKLAAIGLVLGLAVLLPGARLIRGVLVGVTPMDPLALGGGTVLLLATAAAAALLPARRAARIDPMDSLRQE
jgi:predicted permease